MYVVVMKPKRQNQQIFYGHIDPDAESGEDKEEISAETEEQAALSDKDEEDTSEEE